ncbi:MAG TPA: TetR/AcrR family transcriptional regulator [Burkholderiaceae bacterium]|nr:TetR/AcrR family transcriptional regulator [Burkholderiaceae bacterium]
MVKQNSKRPARLQTPARDGDTERRILDAAHVVFVRTGTAGARMQEIAKEAGVNSALLHYYFRTKKRLAEAVFHRAAAQLLPAVAGVLASDQPLADKVKAVVELEIDRLARTPYLPVYILSELAHHPERIAQFVSALTGSQPDALGRRLLSVVGDQIDTEVRAGRMRPIQPEQFLVNLLSLCIFPFAARPMISALMGLDDKAFARFIRDRREALPDFILNAVRP